MTLGRDMLRDAAIGVAVADRPENLTAFRRPGCVAAIWRQRPESGFQSWVDALAPANLPKGRFVLRPDAIRHALIQLCEIADTPKESKRERLIDNATTLAHVFVRLMNAQYLLLRLQAITTNACRKLHIDEITVRLVCTYRGQGTQYGISTDAPEGEL
ncbi:DUF1826 domain-containing protein [Roseobacter weihaiensis]|uniref:DUF1826 domain-containing protein n=1 Tax=Roseobacter weihaiensis TaxID=2763262 RepID=UPI001D0B5B20|nr:DUF1826 domain-containing protein [Roseobacter sp. H9]